MPVVNIGGTTIHSGLGIKPGAKLLCSSEKFKVTFKKSIIRSEASDDQ